MTTSDPQASAEEVIQRALRAHFLPSGEYHENPVDDCDAWVIWTCKCGEQWKTNTMAGPPHGRHCSAAISSELSDAGFIVTRLDEAKKERAVEAMLPFAGEYRHRYEVSGSLERGYMRNALDAALSVLTDSTDQPVKGETT